MSRERAEPALTTRAGSWTVGALARVGALDVAIRRADPAIGEVMLHFPRVGYTIKETSPAFAGTTVEGLL